MTALEDALQDAWRRLAESEAEHDAPAAVRQWALINKLQDERTAECE